MTAPRESAFPLAVDWASERPDAEADVVVVGGGASGLPAALFSRWLGNDVILLEKAEVLGGTANKAAFWYWVPNNAHMDADPEDAFLRYCARLSAPERYDPDSPTLGMDDWEYAGMKAIYASASPAAELLAETRRAALSPLRGGAGLLVRAARGRGADRPRLRPPRRARHDVRRRAERHPHAERGGAA